MRKVNREGKERSGEGQKDRVGKRRGKNRR